MKGKETMKRIIALIMACLCMFMLCACNTHQTEKTDQTESQPVTMSGELAIPNVGKDGGYIISTNNIKIIAYTTGDCKYVEMSSNDGTLLQCYITPEEMIMVDQDEEAIKYFKESFTTEQTYTNPLERIFGSMKGMEFVKSEIEPNKYVAHVHTESEVTKSIPYNVYTITMDWTDGETYNYQYFVYENGEVIVSVDAPDEINPALTKDTAWSIDVNNSVVQNTKTNESVNITITDVTTLEGPPPANGEKETVSKDFIVEVVLNDNGTGKTVRYTSDSLDLTIEILNNFEMTKPEIPENAVEMTSDEATDAMFRVYAAESII